VAGLVGYSAEIPQIPQFRTLKLDDPHILDAYRLILHKKIILHNVYCRAKALQPDATGNEWNLIHKHKYEGVYRDIPAAMQYACKTYAVRNQHVTLWVDSVGKCINVRRYWDGRNKRDSGRHPNDGY
jgi:hypothetical protein